MIPCHSIVATIVLLVALVGCGTADDPSDDAAQPTPTATPSATPSPHLSADDEVTFFAPDLSLQSLAGETYTLSAMRGQWVVLNFWATWCEPCVAEIPMLDALAQQYTNELTVLGVNMRETAAEVSAFQETLPFSYPVLMNPTDAVVLAYHVVGLPQTLIIDPTGEILWRSFGQLDIEEFPAQLEAFINADS